MRLCMFLFEAKKSLGMRLCMFLFEAKKSLGMRLDHTYCNIGFEDCRTRGRRQTGRLAKCV